jgi:hypothetical protein
MNEDVKGTDDVGGVHDSIYIHKREQTRSVSVELCNGNDMQAGAFFTNYPFNQVKFNWVLTLTQMREVKENCITTSMLKILPY